MMGFFIVMSCFLILIGAIHIKLLRKDIAHYYHENKVRELRQFEIWYYLYVVGSVLFALSHISVI